jgi:SAM-dependent methyltransferase
LRPIPDIRGLRFPDEFLVRHFFRRGLHQRAGRVVGLGCGSGCNLALYQAFGWSVAGADIDAQAIEDARWNLGEDAHLVRADLSSVSPRELAGPWDALLAPSSLYYLGTESAERLLRDFAPRLAPGCEVYVRIRRKDDYRCGRGERVAPDTWRLATPETGEAGLINRFYDEAEAVALLRATLDLQDIVVLGLSFDNVQSGVLISPNSDLILTGTTPS